MHPVLFTVGGIEFFSYGLMIGIGYILGVLLAVKRADKYGFDPDSLFGFFLLIVLAGVAGGRLVHIALNTWSYVGLASFFDLRDGGLSIHGVLLGGLLSTVGYAYFRKANLTKLLDAIAPSVALGQSVGRIGCLLSGCCYGIPTNGSWGVLTRFAPGLRHPYPIYESIADFLLFIALLKLSSAVKASGSLTLLYFSGYSVIRFALEFFRSNDEYFAGLSVGQWLSVGLAAICLGLYAHLERKATGKETLVS